VTGGGGAGREVDSGTGLELVSKRGCYPGSQLFAEYGGELDGVLAGGYL